VILFCVESASLHFPPYEDCTEHPERSLLNMRKFANITGLVPFERHLSAARWQFIRGILVGMLISCTFSASAFAYLELRQHGAFLLRSSSQPQTARENLRSQVGPIAGESATDKTAVLLSATDILKSLSEPSTRFAWERMERKGRPKALPPVSSPIAETVTGVRSAQPRPTRITLSRLAQLWASTEAGDARAAVMLADLYLRGDGVPVDCDQARALLFVASKENNAEATKKLQGLNETGCTVP
jgi:hypothetical protein